MYVMYVCKTLFKYANFDKFSDLKTLIISKETKIYRHSWKQRAEGGGGGGREGGGGFANHPESYSKLNCEGHNST